MGGVVRTVGKIAGVVAGIAAIGTGIGAVLGGTMVFTALGGAVAASSIAAGAGLVAGVAGMVAGTPKIPQSETQLGRLNARLDTQAKRKLVLGPRTAMPADIRYYEGSGEDEEYIDYILACAAHRVGSIDEIWFEDAQAWTATGGVQGDYVGYLTTVTTRLEGTASNTVAINGGTRWGSDDRLTGCAYVHLRIKRTGNSDDEQSPLVSGLPGRVTIIGEGMPCYDPRFDDTAGGDGGQRADDQSTWGPSAADPIIQSLNVLLGWRINGKLSVGAGLPPKYIGIDSAITCANMCDEDIALSGGDTQPRYRTAGAFSTDDAPMAIVSALLAGCAGELLDSDGQLSFLIKANTLATPAVEFDDHDVLSAATWDPMGGQTNLPNIIAGTFTDPSANSLYQPAPYPSVSLPSEDGIERTAPVDLGMVENAPQSERLAKQTLQRMQYPGTFSAEYGMTAMAAKVGSIVWQTYSPRGWVNKPFRVVRQKPSRSGRIALVLREENEAIYAWEAEDSASVQAAEPVRFDPRNTGPIMLARRAAESAKWSKVTDDDGHKPEDDATVGAPNGTPVGDRPAEDVTSQLDQLDSDIATANSNISTAQGQIDDLFDTYGSTDAANVARDEAVAAAEAAGLSEEAVEASAIVAANKATAARLALARQFPVGIDASVLTNDSGAGAPDHPAIDPISEEYPAWVVDNGAALLPPVGHPQIAHIATVPLRNGQVFEVISEVEAIAGTSAACLYARVLDASYDLITNITIGSLVDMTQGQRATLTKRISRNSGLPDVQDFNTSGATWLRVMVLINRGPGNLAVNSAAQTKVHSFYARDVTSEKAAEGYASASQASASTASDEAASASQSAGTAATYRNQAQGYRDDTADFAGDASSSASTASSEASVAADAAAAAQQSMQIAVSVGTGALTRNAGLDDYEGALPAQWAASGTVTATRVADPQGGWAIGIPGPAGVLAGIFQNQSSDAVLTPDGYYVVEADVVLNSGTLAGACVILGARDSAGAGVQNLFLHLNSDYDLTGSVPSSPTPGRAYSFRKLVQVTVPTAKGLVTYAFSHHPSANGGMAAANNITWRKASVRPATLEEVIAGEGFPTLSAAVTQNASALATLDSSFASLEDTVSTQGAEASQQAVAISDLESDFASINSEVTAQGVTVSEHTTAISDIEGNLGGSWGVEIDANGNVVGRVRLDGTESVSRFSVSADIFEVDNPDGEAGLSWKDGILWNRGATHSVIQGQGFGASGDLMFWAGPNPASPQAATKAAATIWFDNSGNAYFGGTLSAGILKNSAQTSLLADDASLLLGPFSTNGASKTVTLSYGYSQYDEYTLEENRDDINFPASAQVRLYRSIGGGIWTLIHTLNCNGHYEWKGGQVGDTSYIEIGINGSVTLSDTTAATANLQFRADLITRNVNGNPFNATGTQSISLISTEE